LEGLGGSEGIHGGTWGQKKGGCKKQHFRKQGLTQEWDVSGGERNLQEGKKKLKGKEGP